MNGALAEHAKLNSGPSSSQTFIGWRIPLMGDCMAAVGNPGTSPKRFTSEMSGQRVSSTDFSAEDSPYLFSTLPIEILGSVYERFLGSVVQPNGRVVAKPEVRRAGGVYYTPQHVVDHIVEGTVAPLLRGKSPQQLRRFRVLDPACGSGSFLLRAFERICEHHVEWYLDHPAEQNQDNCYFENEGRDLRLTTSLKRQILRNCIYGIDIDAQAVEVTQLSLYLKLLENETQLTIRRQLALFRYEALLPDLSSNIINANSLLDLDALEVLSEEFDVTELNPLNPTGVFQDEDDFDAVIGNPPYDVLEQDRLKSSWPHLPLRRYIELTQTYNPVLGGKLNLYRLFIARSLGFAKRGGRIGMIVPLSLLGDISCKKTRQHLFDQTSELNADCFPQKDDRNRRIFYDAKLSTLVFTAEKRPSIRSQRRTIKLNVFPANRFTDEHKSATIAAQELKDIDPNVPVPLINEGEWAILRAIHISPSVTFLGRIPEISITRGEINQRIFRRFITSNERHARLVKGVEIGPFRQNERLSQGQREWLDEVRYLRHHTRRPIVDTRRIATQRITGVDEHRRVVATIIEPPAYFADSTNSITVREDLAYTLEYVLGLLNSSLFQWRFSLTSTNNNVGTNELKAMPFRLIDSSNRQDIEARDAIAAISRDLLRLETRLASSAGEHDTRLLQRNRAVLTLKLDSLVNSLFDLGRFSVRPWEDKRGSQAKRPKGRANFLELRVVIRGAGLRAP